MQSHSYLLPSALVCEVEEGDEDGDAVVVVVGVAVVQEEAAEEEENSGYVSDTHMPASSSSCGSGHSTTGTFSLRGSDRTDTCSTQT